jgi:hypothetical protein
MKKVIFCIFILLFSIFSFAQKNVQSLQPVRLSIFKNGTYFIKKTAIVNVINNKFTIASPTNALMGSYWLATSKEASIKSIVVKQDTFRLTKNCKSLIDYLKASINKQIVISKDYFNKQELTGKLLDFDENSKMIKFKTNDNKIIVTDIEHVVQLTLSENEKYFSFSDSITPLATIQLNQNLNNTTATSLSLEKGIQWYPSYLLTLVNDKEATLAMKATIVNNDESFYNTDVDIIIGNPEMFYGQQLDPICTRYLSQELLNYRENNTATYMQTFGNAVAVPLYGADGTISAPKYVYEEENKDGDKLEDLYIYKLGKLDMEKQASIIVPVVNTTINFEDVYTADLDFESANLTKDAVLDVFHKYRIKNKSVAPFTTGSILVIDKNEMPLAQSQLKYTPLNGIQDINISKAIDVQLKNEDVEVKREKTTKKNGDNAFWYKVNYNGSIKIENLQNKKIKIFIKKNVEGVITIVGDKGKSRMLKDIANDNNPTSLMEWEIDLNAGQKMELTYSYSSYKL